MIVVSRDETTNIPDSAWLKLEKRLAAKERHATKQREIYWTQRLAIIRYLGCMCLCGEYDIKNLEIHHEEPILQSPKCNGQWRGLRSGASRIREWKLIMAGKLRAKLVCKICHVEVEHGGNTNGLKGEKHG